jgi:hypothetical protein
MLMIITNARKSVLPVICEAWLTSVRVYVYVPLKCVIQVFNTISSYLIN